jgi:hypothetical protein
MRMCSRNFNREADAVEGSQFLWLPSMETSLLYYL